MNLIFIDQVFVRKLTEEIIEEAVTAYMEDKPDGYWFKLYNFGCEIDISVVDRLKARRIANSKKYDMLYLLDTLKEKINQSDDLKKSNILDSFDEFYTFLENTTI